MPETGQEAPENACRGKRIVQFKGGAVAVDEVEELTQRIVAELERDLSASEMSAVRAFATQTVYLHDARELVARDGMVQFNEQTGMVSPHPAVGIAKAASAELRGWLTARPELFARAAAGSGEGSLADELAAMRAARAAG